MVKAVDKHRFIYSVSSWEWNSGYGIYDLRTQTNHRITGQGDFFGVKGDELFGQAQGTDINTYESSPLPETVQKLLKEAAEWMTSNLVYCDISPNGSLLATSGIWLSENESASFYASICSDLKKRGVSDIFIACHDNLKGVGEAINAVFPKTAQQLCIVHQIRNSTKFVQHKDRKAICVDLKKIYGAINLDDAEYAKEEFGEKWDWKYPSILRSWDGNWAELTTFFGYPDEIRRLIYTTNAVEAYHRMVRKFTKAKAIFPTDDSLRKVVFLSVKEISKKWTMPARNWAMAYSQIMIFFADRFAA